MKRLLKLLDASSAERRLLIVSALLLGVIRVGMWLLPFRTLCRLAAKNGLKTTISSKADQRSIERVGRAVKTASRYIPSTCLTQALATIVILRRLGQPACLRIGVSKGKEGNLHAHAWVESQGNIVVGNLADLSHFSVLPSLDRKL
jgi:hypothetical protein